MQWLHVVCDCIFSTIGLGCMPEADVVLHSHGSVCISTDKYFLNLQATKGRT